MVNEAGERSVCHASSVRKENEVVPEGEQLNLLQWVSCHRITLWETAIAKIAAVDAGYGAELAHFYERCLRFNRRATMAGVL